MAQLPGPGPPDPFHLVELDRRGLEQLRQVTEASHQRALHRLGKSRDPVEDAVAARPDPGVEGPEVEQRGHPGGVADVLHGEWGENLQRLARLGGVSPGVVGVHLLGHFLHPGQEVLQLDADQVALAAQLHRVVR